MSNIRTSNIRTSNRTGGKRQPENTQFVSSCVEVKSSKSRLRLAFATFLLVNVLVAKVLINDAAAQTPPPSLGQETKGTPSVDEEAPLPTNETASSVSSDSETDSDTGSESFLGTATIKESRRENGQIYEIELDHSLGGKQYIQENDSDGNIESTSTDLEETPNLPKWKLGSW